MPSAPASAPNLLTDRPESRLAEALGRVPLEFSGEVIQFADYSGSRAVNGLEEVNSTEEFFQLDSRVRERLYSGVPLHFHLSERISTMIDLIGVDVGAFDLSVWSWQFGKRPRIFLLAEGNFDREIVTGGLRALDYKEGDYAGTAYYRLNEDFDLSLLLILWACHSTGLLSWATKSWQRHPPESLSNSLTLIVVSPQIFLRVNRTEH